MDLKQTKENLLVACSPKTQFFGRWLKGPQASLSIPEIIPNTYTFRRWLRGLLESIEYKHLTPLGDVLQNLRQVGH